MPRFDVAWIQDHANVLVSVHALRCPPVLRVAGILVMFLIEEFHRSRIFIDGEHRCWVVLVPDDTLPIIMGFYRDANLFSNKIADILAASAALLKAVRINVKLGVFEPGLVGGVVVMETGVHGPVAACVKRVLEEVAEEYGVQLGSADGQQKIEVMPCEILNFVHEKNAEIFLHARYDSAYEVGLLDELGEPVGVKVLTGRYVASVVCQFVRRELWRPLKCQTFGVLFRSEKRPVAEAMQEPEVGIERDVRRKVAEPLDDLSTQIVVIQLGVRDDEEALLLIEARDKAGRLARSSDGKDYALIHATASWM